MFIIDGRGEKATTSYYHGSGNWLQHLGQVNMPHSLGLDIAHSLQIVLQETVLDLTEWLYATTKQDRGCMAGGVALHRVMNAFLRDNSSFKEIWVQPAAGDAGTSLGAAIR